ncbi:hypothetical protein SGFS_047890 [Streptomyces graminofaciens]|uniref:Uncharacterized protein n=1 Tax=Streptomyces graminofaciens TaxID=68212 RepID=A0ABN5VJT4_9ACTN|nr:hypothetical protein SGFS_047890 [Streptomyces graminofaciens]
MRPGAAQQVEHDRAVVAAQREEIDATGAAHPTARTAARPVRPAVRSRHATTVAVHTPIVPRACTFATALLKWPA